jgi:heme peroxidase
MAWRRRATARSIRTDGLVNRTGYLALTHGRLFWDFVQRCRPLRRQVNARLIDLVVREMPPRPEPLSTMAPYTSWASLTDRTFSGRHLPPVPDQTTGRPTPQEAAELFRRGETMTPCPRSTVLFAYFAQWFTDGFLRGDLGTPRDPRRNSSNHHIDLNTLYGLNPAMTGALREFEGGRLKSQQLEGGEFPPFLCSDGKIKDEFAPLRVLEFDKLSDARRDTLFALGSDRGNSQIGFTQLTVLFLREHNRVAGLLADRYPSWDDERLFQTARNIVTVTVTRLVVEEYINHITPYHFQFQLDPKLTTLLAHAPWHRENWASVEFNLVYRWHSLIPSTLVVGDQELPLTATSNAPDLLVGPGLGRLFEDASKQRAGRIGLFNTDPLLLPVEVSSVADSRELQLAPYNAYREHCRLPRVRSFDQVNADPHVANALRSRYRSVDDLDLYVGLFAEEPSSGRAVLPPLATKIIAIDAFSQAVTNPLLAPRVLNTDTFTPLGMKIIATTRTLSDVLHRNIPEDPRPRFIGMTRQGVPQ